MGTQFLQHQNGSIAYDDSGSGPLVVCAPSMGDLRSEYRFLIRSWSLPVTGQSAWMCAGMVKPAPRGPIIL